MKTRSLSVALLTALASCAGAHAGVVGGSTSIEGATPGWQTFPGTLNNYGSNLRPYWDNPSMDSGNRNVGNWVAGTYAGSLPAGNGVNPGPSAMTWWGYDKKVTSLQPGSTDGVDGFTFTENTGATVRATLYVEVAGHRNYNEIGWYDTTAAIGAEVLHPIFTGAQSPIVTVDFLPTANWGLYIRSNPNYPDSATKGWVFFSQSNRNDSRGFSGNAYKGHQHFALFAHDLTPGAERYMVGVEDLPLSNTGIELSGDYNDVIFTLQTVPTPGAAALAGVGGLLVLRRRRSA